MLEDTTGNRQRKLVSRAINRRSFCTLATSSEVNRPHVVGVLYAAVDGLLYVSTLETSVKARNIRANPRVAVCIPVRRFPVGPPFHVAFQGRAELCPRQDPRIVRLLEAKRLKPITSHGELDDPDSCFVIITPGPRVATYGLGVPVRRLLRDPVHASGSVELT
jgi:hypothetical protein